MNNELPLVSIVTPSFQQGEFIEDMILSVRDQMYPNIEHIIIDGGSTDGTIGILKRYEGGYRMSWISEPDDGQADAVNEGLSRASGEIVGWLNSDDVYFDEHVVAEVVNEFARSGADVVFGNDALIGQYGELLRIRMLPNFSYGRLLRYGGISQPAVFLRRQVFDGQGLRKDLNFAMDTELWLRLARKYRFVHLDSVLAGNRIHARRKMITNKKEAYIERRAVAKEYGLHWNGWTALQTLLYDRPLTAILRVRGLWSLWRLQSSLERPFPFIFPPDKLSSAIKAQLIGKF